MDCVGGPNVTEEEVAETSDSEEEEQISGEEEVMVTVWSPEATENIELNNTPVDEWVRSIDFNNTEEVPIPERLVDQVIGQEAGSVVIRKAAEQRRHMMMIGDPGTGKSMLARSMTELLPQDKLEDILCYPNDDDENEDNSSAYAGVITKTVRQRILKGLREYGLGCNDAFQQSVNKKQGTLTKAVIDEVCVSYIALL